MMTSDAIRVFNLTLMTDIMSSLTLGINCVRRHTPSKGLHQAKKKETVLLTLGVNREKKTVTS